ncbi:coiled-coil domain-containing protein 171 isoform X2 [Protopterus annectens]|uniref:coiled-coil domain-containing protein 171 isoform X2 n=1 Tax=Protopterus annectens TaxID=7888 RepID=UPI001CFB2E8B|nr:coiled-coil domain-containing protein 171 isoform X2 [Protopterus annectens]
MTSRPSGNTDTDETKKMHNTVCDLQSEIKHLTKGSELEFDIIADLRWKLNQAEKAKLELTTKNNEELARYETQITRLRAQLERGEAKRQNLEYELALSRKEAGIHQCTSEERLATLNLIQEQLAAQKLELKQKREELEKALKISQEAREDDHQRFQAELEERDNIIQQCNAENESLRAEIIRLENVLQEQEDTLEEMQKKLKELEILRTSHLEAMRLQASELEYSSEREERLKKELEAAVQRVKHLEESIETERATHLESKFNSEIIQLRIRDLEGALQVEKASHAEVASNLEMIKQQFREVEKAYEREKKKQLEITGKLHKLESEHLSAVKQLNKEVEEKKKIIGDLSKKLQNIQKDNTELREELNMAKKHQAFLEETYGGSMRELELLLDSFAVSGMRKSGICQDRDKPHSPSAVLETLRHTLTDYQSRLEDTSNELDRQKTICEKMTEECKFYKEMKLSQDKNLEEFKMEIMKTKKELNNLHEDCANRESAVECLKSEMNNMQQRFQMEYARAAAAEEEIQKITEIHKKDSQEKLTFLHSLYQRLVAGCVLIKHPEGMLGKFSWHELCAVLQENVDAMTSDLNKANEKMSYLENLCKSKVDTIKELQKTQEDAFSKVAEQMKEREISWQKQNKNLEQHYSALIGEVHTRAQKCQEIADISKEKIAGLEKVKDHLALENSHFRNLLSVSQKEHASLLVACALLAGALYPLYGRACVLYTQKNILQNQINTFETVKHELWTLIQALSGESRKNREESRKKKKCFSGMIRIFRKSAIVILAVNRLKSLGRSSRRIFSWTEGYRGGVGLLICSGGSRSVHSLSSQQNEHALKWFTSANLQSAVVGSVAELLEVVSKADHSCFTSGHLLINAAQNSFTKLMNRLRTEMDNDSLDSCVNYYDKSALIQRLSHGLHRVNTNILKSGHPVSVSIKHNLTALQKHILAFTQRLHTAEVERRALRLELAAYKQNVSDLKRDANKSRSLEEQLNEFRQASQNMVPFEKFECACTELNSALQREQQAQLLLNEQAHQLHELNLRLELHSSEEADKDQTLSEAVKSLSEAKMELRRKDQSLRQLNKHLTQLEQDKCRLEESIRNAESALRMAAKDKEHLISSMKLTEADLQKVRDQISLSWTAASRNDFTLQMPKLHVETFTVEGQKGRQEFATLQNMICSFMDIYKLVSSRISTLEMELVSHQKHIIALKSELQTACLRESMGAHQEGVSRKSMGAQNTDVCLHSLIVSTVET